MFDGYRSMVKLNIFQLSGKFGSTMVTANNCNRSINNQSVLTQYDAV